LTDTYFVVQ